MPPSPHGFFVRSAHQHFIESPHGMRGGGAELLAPGFGRVNVVHNEQPESPSGPLDNVWVLDIFDHDPFTENTTDTPPDLTILSAHRLWSNGYGQELAPGTDVVSGSRYLTAGNTIAPSTFSAIQGTTNIREYDYNVSPRASVVVGSNDFSADDVRLFYQSGTALVRRSVIVEGSAQVQSGYDLGGGSEADEIAIEIDSSFDPVYVFFRYADNVLKLDGAGSFDWSFDSGAQYAAMEGNPTGGTFHIAYNQDNSQSRVYKLDSSTGDDTVVIAYSEPADPDQNREVIRGLCRVKDSLYVLCSQQVAGVQSGDNLFSLFLDKYDRDSPGGAERKTLVSEWNRDFFGDPFNQSRVTEGHSLE